MNRIPVIKQESLIGYRGGGKKWPLWMVQLIYELLVNGTPPSSVNSNISFIADVMNGSEAKEIH